MEELERLKDNMKVYAEDVSGGMKTLKDVMEKKELYESYLQNRVGEMRVSGVNDRVEASK